MYVYAHPTHAQVSLALGECYVSVEQTMESLAIRQEMCDATGQAECLRFLSQAYTAQGKLATARKVAEQARELSLNKGDLIPAGKADMLIAEV